MPPPVSEPVEELELEPIEPFTLPPPVGNDTWQEEQPAAAIEGEPFAELLEHAGASRSSWTHFDQRAWEEVD